MPVPGRPRLVPIAGGELPSGAPEPSELLLEPGAHDHGDPPVAQFLVAPSGEVTLVARSSRVLVDGQPVKRMLLSNGNRIELPDGALAFLCDWLEDDGGRQGGEQLHPLVDVDRLDRQ
jgi:hypothetical protein